MVLAEVAEVQDQAELAEAVVALDHQAQDHVQAQVEDLHLEKEDKFLKKLQIGAEMAPFFVSTI